MTLILYIAINIIIKNNILVIVKTVIIVKDLSNSKYYLTRL